MLGVSSAQLAQFLHGSLSGTHGQHLPRRQRADRDAAARPGRGARAAGAARQPGGADQQRQQRAAVADRRRSSTAFEDGIIWHRNRLPTVTVRADIYGEHARRRRVTAQILPTLDDDPRAAAARLPAARPAARSRIPARGQNSVDAGVPLFLLVVITLLMLQLRSFSRTAMVLLTAPLGLIGVTLFLLVFRVPFGFVAMLGTIALSGMIMRNSVILVDQIDQDIAAGHAPLAGDRRRDRAPLPPDRADRAGGGAGDDPAVAQRVLRADGGGDHGRPDRRHRADAAVPAGAVRGVVPGEARLRDPYRAAMMNAARAAGNGERTCP